MKNRRKSDILNYIMEGESVNAYNDSWTRWSSKEVLPVESFDSWYSALNKFHLGWTLHKPNKPVFTGEIKTKQVGDVQFVDCLCDPCSGERNFAEISRDTEEFYGLLLIHDGRELISHYNKDVTAQPGDVFFWDSTMPLKFYLPGNLKKTTLFIPQETLRRQIANVDDFIGTVLPAREGLGALVNANVKAMGSQLHNMDENEYAFSSNLVLELISYWLGRVKPLNMTAPRRELLDRILNHIEGQLSDPDLTPAKIAAECNISLRHLHRVFSSTDTTVSQWITTRRLERCRQELSMTGRTMQTVTDIAFRWGFNDVSHFNRIFKRTFRITPGQYQKKIS